MEMPHGRNSLAVLLTQDVAVVPLALLMASLGGEGTAADVFWNIGKLLLMAGGLVVGLHLLTRVAVLVLGTLTLHRNRELTIVFAVVAGLGAAWASHAVGISPALGAFVAGMLLGSSAFATQIRADVSPLRIVLLTLFFGAAGMVADPIWILSNWYIVGAAVVAVTAGKMLVTWVVFFLFLGQTTRIAAATGLCLAQVGEFAFVLGSIGRTSGVVTEDVYGLVVSVAIVSFFLSAFLVPKAPTIGNRIAQLLKSKQTSDDAPPMIETPDVIIIGFGPAGQIAASPLVDKGIRVSVIDLNQDGVRRAQQLGFHGDVGDATQNEVLEHARLHECKAVVITVPHHLSALTILEHVRKEAPHAHVIVRSRYELDISDLLTAGAHAVAGDEQQVGERLAEHIATWLDESRLFGEHPQEPVDDKSNTLGGNHNGT